MARHLLAPYGSGHQLLTTPEYFESLARDIGDTVAGDRVMVVTMGFDPEEDATHELLHDSMILAARRDVDVTLVTDGYAFMFDEGFMPTGPLVPGFRSRKPKPYFQRKTDELNLLASEGIMVGVSHVPEGQIHLTYAGRSHIKGAIVNNAYYIGGCGLDNTTTPDAMIRVEGASAADYLSGIYDRLARGHKMATILDNADVTFEVDQSTDIYLDAGKRNQSLILDKALGIIDNAEEWVMMSCQFFPGGRTAEHLAKAFTERGVKPYVVYNSPKEKRLGGNVMNLLSKYDRRRLPPEIFEYMLPPESPFVHAKVLASEKEGIIASHNYINHGSILGTAELAFHRREATFGRELGSLIMRLIDWEHAFPNSDAPRKVLGLAS